MVPELNGVRQPRAADPARSGRVDTPLGLLGIAWRGRCLTGIQLEPSECCGTDPAPVWLAKELDAYFSDPAYRFRCALAPSGTPFQHRVWALITAIPAGATRTYGELAADLGTAARAVGNACRANPLPLAVPCHRVVGAAGLGGFAGDTSGRLLRVKCWLLSREGVLPADARPRATVRGVG